MAIRDLHVSVSNATIYAAIDDKVAVWDAHTYERLTSQDIADTSETRDILGIWSDDTTMWISRRGSRTLKAYNISDGMRHDPDEDNSYPKDFTVSFNHPSGMAATDTHLYIASESLDSSESSRLYAFNLTDKTADTSRNLSVGFRARGAYAHYETTWFIYAIPVEPTDRLDAREVSRGGQIHANQFIGLPSEKTICGMAAFDLSSDEIRPAWLSIHETSGKIPSFTSSRSSADRNPAHSSLRGVYSLRPQTRSDLILADGDQEVAIDYSIADERSYVSANEARTIAEMFTASPPSASQIQSPLLRAMPYIEQYKDRFIGERATESQTLSWPRDINEEVDGHEIDDETIPEAIKQAQVLVALRILGGNDPYGYTNQSAASASGARVTKQQVGSILLEYSYESGTTVGSANTFSVLDLLRPYLRGGSSNRIRRV